MATTVQPVQTPTDSGVAPADLSGAIVAGPANDNAFPNTGQLVLHVGTAAGGAVNITIVNQTMQEGNPGPNKVINVPANSERVIGPLPPGVFNDSNGQVHVQVDTPANLTRFRAYQLPAH